MTKSNIDLEKTKKNEKFKSYYAGQGSITKNRGLGFLYFEQKADKLCKGVNNCFTEIKRFTGKMWKNNSGVL